MGRGYHAILSILGVRKANPSRTYYYPGGDGRCGVKRVVNWNHSQITATWSFVQDDDDGAATKINKGGDIISIHLHISIDNIVNPCRRRRPSADTHPSRNIPSNINFMIPYLKVIKIIGRWVNK